MPLAQRDHIDEHSGGWESAFIPVPQPSREFSVQSHYVIRKLRANAVYDVIIKAKNKYGFSEYSKIFNFYNKGVGESRTGLCEP